MKTVLGVLIILPIAVLRLVIAVIGLFGLPLFFKPFYGERYKATLWETYWEMAIRNPTNGMAGWFAQPAKETRPNPDSLVRGNLAMQTSASRWTSHGIYWEYWHLRQIDWTLFGKHYKWFEIRFGWKYVDGNDEFFPTFQFGPRSS